MANTYVDYTGDGNTTSFAYTFAVLSGQQENHIIVGVDDSTTTGGKFEVVAPADYTIDASAGTITFDTAPESGARIRIRRDSDASTLLVDFKNGTVLPERDLDLAYVHNLYLNEEIEEGSGRQVLTKNDDGNYDGDSVKLVNLADPENAQDAVTKGYADGRYVDEAGDTMTGNLAMSNNNITGVNTVSGLATPTSDNHAANKKYVDDGVAAEAAARVTNDALQVTKAGDSMSGNLTMTSPAKVIQNQAPTSGDDLTNKTYVDNATTTLTNDKVSKSGDTMTGALTLPNADPSNGNHATRKTYVDAQIAATLATGVAGGPVDTVNIADDAVTFAKMQNINTAKVIGRTTAGSGDPEEVTILDEDTMTSDSETSLATQQSIKAYVDTAVSGVGGEDNVQANWTESDSTSDAFIQNKPSLATVATTGNYSDLSGTPSLATVATSGDYSDLSGTPTIPTNNNQLTNGAGYTTNTGTVTQVGTGTGLTGGPITSSGTISLASIANLRVLGNVSGSSAAPGVVQILDEDAMGTNSATALATQQSIKAYVDSQVTSVVSKVSSGFLSTHGSTAVSNGNTLSFAHSLGTTSVTVAVYVGQSNGTNAVLVTSADRFNPSSPPYVLGTFPIIVNSNTVNVLLGSQGFLAPNAGGSPNGTITSYGAANYTHVNIVVTG